MVCTIVNRIGGTVKPDNTESCHGLYNHKKRNDCQIFKM